MFPERRNELFSRKRSGGVVRLYTNELFSRTGMHCECYYHYHQLRYGVYLDNRYELNTSRAKQGMCTQLSRKDANFLWSAVQPDIHSSESDVDSHSSKDNLNMGSWEASTDQEDAKAGKKAQEEGEGDNNGSAVQAFDLFISR